VPTANSLAFAAQISELLDIPFDKDAIDAQARSLHEGMFEALIDALELDANAVKMQSGYYFATRAFAINSVEGTPQIGVDITFDYWLSALNLICAIATFETPTNQQWEGLALQTDSTFHLFDDARRFEQARDGLKPYLVDHHNLLNLSEGLARAMLVFTFCHELAHCHLDHLNQPANVSQELDADKLAAQYFLTLLEKGAQLADTTIFVDIKLAGAPLILMQLLNVHEQWLAHQGRLHASDTHPHALNRLNNILPLFEPFLNETATTIVDAMTLGAEDIGRILPRVP